MKENISSMAIVIGNDKVLMLNSKGRWVFPKGHVESGETYLQAAIRELKEESDVDVVSENCLGQIDEFKFYFDKEKAMKVIKVFLFKIDNCPKITFQREEDFIDGDWFDFDEGLNLLFHDDARAALKKSLLKLGIKIN